MVEELYLDYMIRFERNYCAKYFNRLLRQTIAYFISKSKRLWGVTIMKDSEKIVKF